MKENRWILIQVKKSSEESFSFTQVTYLTLLNALAVLLPNRKKKIPMQPQPYCAGQPPALLPLAVFRSLEKWEKKSHWTL